MTASAKDTLEMPKAAVVVMIVILCDVPAMMFVFASWHKCTSTKRQVEVMPYHLTMSHNLFQAAVVKSMQEM